VLVPNRVDVGAEVLVIEVRVISVIFVDVVVDVCRGSLGLVVLATGVVDESVDRYSRCLEFHTSFVGCVSTVCLRVSYA
jgi:hypothetical protein